MLTHIPLFKFLLDIATCGSLVLDRPARLDRAARERSSSHLVDMSTLFDLTKGYYEYR